MITRNRDISQERLKELFDYNSEGFFISKISTNNNRRVGQEVRGSKQNGHYRLMVDGKYYALHRLIVLYNLNIFPDYIDHIDGDSTNNRLENLREATQSQNIANGKIRSDNKHGVKGVWFCNTFHVWVGRIYWDKKHEQIRSKKKQEVIKWIKQRRIELHGEFAREK